VRNFHVNPFLILIAGDFNSLTSSFMESDFGLEQILDKPTHYNHTFDKVYIYRPDIYVADVFSSLTKTEHRAVYVRQRLGASAMTGNQNRAKFILYHSRPHHIESLRFLPWHF
jgi:hypothetical protein